MLTTQELCEFLKIHENTVYQFIKDGIPNVRIGKKSYRFDKEEVLEWLRERAK